MNHIERFKAVMNFQPVDRLPRIEWASWWDETLLRWHAEGLPASLTDPADLRRHFGLDPYHQVWFKPQTDELPEPSQHGGARISSIEEYEAVKPCLYPPQESVIAELRPWADAQDRGEVVVWITLDGFFWFPRKLLGIERHFYAFYDQPELIHRINADLVDYHLRIIRALSGVCRPAFMTFAEDMSYNHGPMLSRPLFDDFLKPCYDRVIPALKEMGTRVLVDTDGDVSMMVPWLENAGIEGVLPLERQAGVDATDLRRKHPEWLMIGHYDKMKMSDGEQAIREEFERLEPVMSSGGFIPGVDHQTPPEVSLDNYRSYLEMLFRYTERTG